MAAVQRGALVAPRATGILATACRVLAGEGCTVLLPALYCREVADAIEREGCSVICYDVAPDLSGPIGLPSARVDVVVRHHPFGCLLRTAAQGGPVVIEDACWTLGTLLARSGTPDCDLMVFSPRKEFGWVDGGVAVGRYVDAVRAACPPPDARLVARWNALDAAEVVVRGARASRAAVRELGDRLPPLVTEADVLTQLPLVSARRDEVVDALRAAGAGAWYWDQPMTGCTARDTPQAANLARRLLLVPTPEPGSSTYRLIRSLPVDRWNGGAP